MTSILNGGEAVAMKTIRNSRLSAVIICRHLETSSRTRQLPAAAPTEVTSAKASERAIQDEGAIKPASELPGLWRLPSFVVLFIMMKRTGFDNKKIHLLWPEMVKEFGPISRSKMPFMPPMVTVTNPDDVEKMMKSTMDNPIREGFFSLRKVRQDAIDNYFDNKCGLLTENNEEWKRVRTRVQTPMMKPKNITHYLASMDQVALEFMDRIAVFQKEHGEMPSDFQNELYKWALESVGVVALNRRLGCLEPNLSEDSEPMTMIREVNNIFSALNDTEISNPLWRFFRTPSYKRLEKSHNTFLRIADENIQVTEAQLLAKNSKQLIDGDNLTLMETLLLTPGLSRKDVVTLIIDMLFAGIDTTSNSLGFTLYLLAKHPECQAKLQEEVDGVIGDHEGPLTPNHLAQMSYLKAVVKESLRIFPIVIGTGRTLQSDLVLSNYLIPKGFVAIAPAHVMGQDEGLFTRAKEFIPDRWLRHKPLGPIHPYSSLPFSIGTRMCIGRRIAEQEMYTFLTRVMHRYTVDYKYQEMSSIFRFVFVPSEPLRFNFTERR